MRDGADTITSCHMTCSALPYDLVLRVVLFFKQKTTYDFFYRAVGGIRCRVASSGLEDVYIRQDLQ